MDGIIVINKPKGCTSHDIVHKVKTIFHEKVGHTGTLDPLATGVLPILVGKGTQCSKYLIQHDKIYQAEIQLGKKTDTADGEGQVIEEKPILESMLEKEFVEMVFKNFEGKQKQVPPMYSAIKVKGKKLYEYAREGKKLDIQPREIEIYSLELVSIEKQESRLNFRVHCSKGTYIRSLCEDIAEKLGTVGYMSNLTRIRVGTFDIQEAITIEELEKQFDTIGFLPSKFITIEDVFQQNEMLFLEDKLLALFLNGVQLTKQVPDGVYKIYNSQKDFVGTGTVKQQRLKRDIIVI